MLLAISGILLVVIGWPKRVPRHRVTWRGWVRYSVAAACVLSLLAGGLTSLHKQARKASVMAIMADNGRTQLLTIRLTSDARERSEGYGANAALIGPSNRGDLWGGHLPVYILNAEPGWRVGEEASVIAHVFDGDDQRVLLSIVSVESHKRASGVYTVVDMFRQGVRKASNYLPPQGRGLVPGVAIGDDRRLPEHLAQAMRSTSLTHLTAVSGAHMAVVLGTTLMATARLPRWLRVGIGFGVLSLMVVVVLPTPSVVRAGGMGVITLYALLRRKPRLALSALFATVIGLLFYDPWLATSIGFGLSVFATAGILTSARLISEIIGKGAVAKGIGVAAAAQLWCAPLLLSFDPSLPTYAVPANLIALPALAPATILSLLSAVTFPLLPSVAIGLAKVANFFTAWIATCAVIFANLPGARLPWLEGVIGVVDLIGWILLVLWGVMWLKRKKTWQA